jgi:hypothetical protein
MDLPVQLPMQSVPITTKIVSSNLAYGEVYSGVLDITLYEKFVSDLRQVNGFPCVLQCHPPIKRDYSSTLRNIIINNIHYTVH